VDDSRLRPVAAQDAVGIGQRGTVLEEKLDDVLTGEDPADVAGLGMAEADASPASIHALAKLGVGSEHGVAHPGGELVGVAVLGAEVVERLGHLRQTRPVRDDVKRVIETGYDTMADRFAAWQREIEGSTQIERVEALLALLPEQPDILELGVGAGVQSSRLLAERGRLTGVDISAEQLRRARERVPGATFLHGDFTQLELEPESFDAVVAAYVLNHVAGGARAAPRARRSLAAARRPLPRHVPD
jgi:methyltransferase family protein